MLGTGPRPGSRDFKAYSACIPKNKYVAYPSVPTFFMNIFTSEVFHWLDPDASWLRPTVSSVPPIACRAASDTRSA